MSDGTPLSVSDETEARIMEEFRAREHRIYDLAVRGNVDGLRDLALDLNRAAKEADRNRALWLSALAALRIEREQRT